MTNLTQPSPLATSNETLFSAWTALRKKLTGVPAHDEIKNLNDAVKDTGLQISAAETRRQQIAEVLKPITNVSSESLAILCRDPNANPGDKPEYSLGETAAAGRVWAKLKPIIETIKPLLEAA